MARKQAAKTSLSPPASLVHHTEKLHYFHEIATEGSYQATARKLGVSAPTLSYAIRQVEEALGSPVFHRSTRGITLTDAGQTLEAFCRRYFRDLEQTEAQIRGAAGRSAERLRIGTFPSIAIYFWPSLLEALDRDPFTLSISTGRSRAILESLIRREVDIALTVEDSRHPSLIRHELYRDQYSLYVAADWRTGRLAQDEVHQHPILYIPDAIDQDRRTLRQHVHSWGCTFRDEFELDSFEVIGEFVRQGHGIGILPMKVARTHGDAVRRLRIDGLPANRFGIHRFFLSYRDDLDMPHKVMTSILTAARKAVRLQRLGP